MWVFLGDIVFYPASSLCAPISPDPVTRNFFLLKSPTHSQPRGFASASRLTPLPAGSSLQTPASSLGNGRASPLMGLGQVSPPLSGAPSVDPVVCEFLGGLVINLKFCSVPPPWWHPCVHVALSFSAVSDCRFALTILGQKALCFSTHSWPPKRALPCFLRSG